MNNVEDVSVSQRYQARPIWLNFRSGVNFLVASRDLGIGVHLNAADGSFSPFRKTAKKLHQENKVTPPKMARKIQLPKTIGA